LAALDVLPEAGLYWVGNANELNAGKSNNQHMFTIG
jgi:TPP-dependent 2-oxoacid decarboxylase